MSGFKPCVLIPTYDNPATIGRVVESVRAYSLDTIVIDDGSSEPTQRALRELCARGLCRVVRRERNGGKGAAVKTGFAAAIQLGFTHALQLDADGQHSSDDIPRFLEASRAQPAALILGAPQFGPEAPRARLYGRKISVFFARLEAGGRFIADPLCGFRMYPLASAAACAPRADRMQFDPEIAVRMVWAGVPVQNLPTKVTYVSRADGGVSHFQVVRDNARISFMHSRLMCTMIFCRVLGRQLPALSRATTRLPASSERERGSRPAT